MIRTITKIKPVNNYIHHNIDNLYNKNKKFTKDEKNSFKDILNSAINNKIDNR